MEQLIQYFIWIPALGFLVKLLFSPKNEKLISGSAIFFATIQFFSLAAFLIYWGFNDFAILEMKGALLYHSDNLEISLNFFFDKITAFFSLIGSFIYLIVVIFSKYYMHRDPGFKRYFSTISFFFVSYNFLIFSGNFETLFIGWEFLGLCSFLLIAYYRERYLPVKNSMKTIAVYRIGDICLFLAMWMSHHLLHENITFAKMNLPGFLSEQIDVNYWSVVFIAVVIVIAAAVKSAQLPFSSWLPRAMEGPTTSSAVFYGSLSVHLGVFILLRTYPYWENLTVVKILIIAMGIATALITTSIARVQSTVKTQIAYSSAAQIGLIFIEIGFGFHWLALIHFSGNALLRTYQLLVSPSVLSYKTHDMVFSHTPKVKTNGFTLLDKIKNTIYVLSIKEWNLDNFIYRFLAAPARLIGRVSNFFPLRAVGIFLILTFLAGLFVFFYPTYFSQNTLSMISIVAAIIATVLIIKSLTEKGDGILTWIQLVASQIFLVFSVAVINNEYSITEIIIYLASVIFASIVGMICLKKIKRLDGDITMKRYHGYIYKKPFIALVFLLCCIALAGLPLTPTFIGVDILFSHIKNHQIMLIVFSSISYLLFEIAVLRIYVKIFLGPYKIEHHAMTFKSS